MEKLEIFVDEKSGITREELTTFVRNFNNLKNDYVKRQIIKFIETAVEMPENKGSFYETKGRERGQCSIF